MQKQLLFFAKIITFLWNIKLKGGLTTTPLPLAHALGLTWAIAETTESMQQHNVEKNAPAVLLYTVHSGCSTTLQGLAKNRPELNARPTSTKSDELITKPRASQQWSKQLPFLHCTVIGFALDWESHKSLKHDRECLTELLERAFFQPYPIQQIQLAEVDWESANKGFERKRGWVVCIKSCATVSVLVWC